MRCMITVYSIGEALRRQIENDARAAALISTAQRERYEAEWRELLNR